MLFLGCLLTAAAGARAQDSVLQQVRFDPLEWEVVLEFDGSREKVESSGTTTDLEFKEGLRLKQGGYVVDPRIANFSVEIFPTLSQERVDGPGYNQDTNGTFVDYAVSLSAFNGARTLFGFNAEASRNTGTLDGSLGSRTEFTTDNRYVGINYKNLAFPTTLSYSENVQDQSFRSGLTSASSARDDTLRTVRLHGRSSKLDAIVEQNWFDDQLLDNDYQAFRERLAHTFRWGKNSSARTDQEFYNRTGHRPYERHRFSEAVRLQHLTNLYSTIDYDFFNLQQDTDTVTHTGLYSINHQLYTNLNTTAALHYNNTDFDVGTEEEYGADLDFAYRKKIPWDGRLSLGLGGGYALTDRQATGAPRSAVDESHVVPASLVVLLNQRYIDTGTIVVTNQTSTQTYTEGSDYLVRAVSASRTELLVLGGGQIAAAQTILVSYQFNSAATAEFSTRSLRYNAGLDFGWINIYHRFDADNEVLESGADPTVLHDRRDRVTGVKLRWSGQSLRLGFGAERHEHRAGDFNTDTDTLTQTLVYGISRNALLSVTGSETYFESDGRDVELLQMDANLRWLPYRDLVVEPFIGMWRRDDEGGADEEFFTAGVELDYSLRLFDFRLKLSREDRSGNNTDRTEDRLMLKLVRRSR